LEQGFTSGEKDMFGTGFFDLKQDRIKIHPYPAFKAVRGIAIGATEVAASKSYKDKRNSAERGLALKRMEDFCDKQSVKGHRFLENYRSE
jgi:hypothetical protein